MTPINHIKIGGQNRPIHFGFAALADFSQIAKIGIDQILTLAGSFTLDLAIILIWAGLKQGARKEKKPFPFEWQDVADWLDDTPDAMEAAMQIFAASIAPERKDAEPVAEGNAVAGEA